MSDFDKEKFFKEIKRWQFWVAFPIVTVGLMIQFVFEVMAIIFEGAHGVSKRAASEIAFNKWLKSLIDWAVSDK